jgi:hypothetical protein
MPLFPALTGGPRKRLETKNERRKGQAKAREKGRLRPHRNMSNYTFELKPYMSQSLERLSEDLEMKRPDVLRVAIGMLRAVVEQLKSGGESLTVTIGDEPKAILIFPELDVAKKKPGHAVSHKPMAANSSDVPTPVMANG